MPLHLPQRDPQPRVTDERIRFYRMSTPRGSIVTLGLGGQDDPVTLLLARPIEVRIGVERVRLPMSAEEAWALYGCLADALGAAGEPPAWVTASVGPTDADGGPLPPLPGALSAEPL